MAGRMASPPARRGGSREPQLAREATAERTPEGAALHKEIVEERQERFLATSEMWDELHSLKQEIKRVGLCRVSDVSFSRPASPRVFPGQEAAARAAGDPATLRKDLDLHREESATLTHRVAGLQTCVDQQLKELRGEVMARLVETLEVVEKSQGLWNRDLDRQLGELRGLLKDAARSPALQSAASSGPPTSPGGRVQDKLNRMEEEASATKGLVWEVQGLLALYIVRTSRLALEAPQLNGKERQRLLTDLEAKEKAILGVGQVGGPQETSFTSALWRAVGGSL